ncbi:class I adenylate cyclase, partial [Vibrio campbellii]
MDLLNQQRVERALALMNVPCQQVFHLIPTLLHFNHPILPGYYSELTPYGVFGLELNDNQQKFVANTEMTVGHPLHQAVQPAINALYT